LNGKGVQHLVHGHCTEKVTKGDVHLPTPVSTFRVRKMKKKKKKKKRKERERLHTLINKLTVVMSGLMFFWSISLSIFRANGIYSGKG